MQDKKSLLKYASLALLVSTIRENVGLSQSGLAKKSGLPVQTIEDIESGVDLFLSSGIRQKLAKGLKLDPKDIKPYERHEDIALVSDAKYLSDLKFLILEDQKLDIICPICKSKLVVKIEKMYDLEDNEVLHPKAHCSKCVFQIK